jgi:pentatricopeptide repeat protein
MLKHPAKRWLSTGLNRFDDEWVNRPMIMLASRPTADSLSSKKASAVVSKVPIAHLSRNRTKRLFATSGYIAQDGLKTTDSSNLSRLHDRANKLIRETENLLQNSTHDNKLRLSVFNLKAITREFNALLRDLERCEEKTSVSNSSVLTDAVLTFDKFARAALNADNANTNCNNTYAIKTAVNSIQAWARIARKIKHARIKARELFDAINFSFGPLKGEKISKTLIQIRQSLYHALLLASARAAQSSAATISILEEMKREGEIYKIRLADTIAYNRVASALASQGDVAGVELLWDDMLQNGVVVDAHSYDWFVKAYRVLNEKDTDERHVIRAVEIFTKQLHSYKVMSAPRDPSLRPLQSTLQMVLGICRNDLLRARKVFQLSSALEETCPECRGFLVDERVFMNIMQLYTAWNQVAEAEQLLNSLFSKGHLRPNRKHIGIVLNGYIRLQSPRSVFKAETILKKAEKAIIELGPSKIDIDFGAYSILMKGYLDSSPTNAVEPIQNCLHRMTHLAGTLHKPDLLPNIVCYNLLMQALSKRQRPGFASDVNKVLEHIESEPRFDTISKTVSRSIALAALSNSDDVGAMAAAQHIFDRMESPDQAAFNTLLNMYAVRDRIHDVNIIFERMRARPGPDVLTYNTLLSMLKRNNDNIYNGRWARARNIFQEMLQGGHSPDTGTAELLFGILAQDDSVNRISEAAIVWSRLDKALQQNVRTAKAYSRLCCEVEANPDESKLLIATLLNNLIDVGPQSDQFLYDATLKAGYHLLACNPDERDRFVIDVFKLCANSGKVSASILQTLQTVCSSEVIAQLTCQNDSNELSIGLTPEAWSRNVRLVYKGQVYGSDKSRSIARVQ